MGKTKHLVAEGFSDSPVLSNEAALVSAVTRLTSYLKMRPLSMSSVDVPLEISKLGEEPFEDEGGISVCCILSTSHIALHTWPLRKEFHLDVYSCREFEPDTPIKWARVELEASKLRAQRLERPLSKIWTILY